jgi:predicted TIM-barrel fold metal-dependent hydrolase
VPLQDDMKLISVDDHLVEPAGLWEDRLPKALRDRGPRVIDAPEGEVDFQGNPLRPESQVWTYEGKVYPTVAMNAVAGRNFEDYTWEPYRYDDILPGCYDPIARVKDMDVDGVQASACFPTFPGFAGGKFVLFAEDKDLALACIRVYNDYVIDEWCGSAPDRLIPMVIVPLWDGELARAEAERTAAKGARAITFPDSPARLGLPSYYTEYWDPMLAVAEEAGMPLCKHFGTSEHSRTNRQVSPESPETVTISLAATTTMYSLADLLQSPVFHKFPRLKVALSEGGIGWIPYLLERLDYIWDRHRFHEEVNRDVAPSQLFADHVWGCFIDDEVGIELRHRIGVSQITWELDYPHADTMWPHAREHTAKRLQEVPDDEVRQIVELNARRLFDFTADLDATA